MGVGGLGMSNPVTIKVGSASYNILTDDSPERILRASEAFDRRVCSYLSDSRIAPLAAVVLSGVDVTLESLDASAENESLRVQLRDYIAENARLKTELAEIRREKRK